MRQVRKITVEVPEELLARARQASGTGLTATVREGLRLVAASQAFKSLRARRGTVLLSRSAADLRDDRS